MIIIKLKDISHDRGSTIVYGIAQAKRTWFPNFRQKAVAA